MKKSSKIYVCTACGKRSYDKYGEKPIDHGWDVSCVMNSHLVYENKLIYVDGVVVGMEKDAFVLN